MSALEHAARWLFTLSFGSALVVLFVVVIFITTFVCIIGALLQSAWRSLRALKERM